MKHLPYGIIYGVLWIGMFSSCAYKTDRKGTADGITWALSYSGEAGNYILTKEEIFHQHSRTTKGGSTIISGAVSIRFTSYDAASGEIVSRWVAGKKQQKNAEFLGYTGNKLWFYSVQKALSFHARDPRTLQVVSTKEDLFSADPGLAKRISEPGYNDIDQYTGFDPWSERIIMTDLSGQVFWMDLVTGKVENTAVKPHTYFSAAASATDASITPGHYFSMQGELRKKTAKNGVEMPGEDSFLEGVILLEKDPQRCITYTKTFSDSLPGIPEHNLLQTYLLGLDSNVIYVEHAANTTDTAALCISRIHIGASGSKTEWTVTVPGIYFYISRMSGQPLLKKQVGSGDPSFQWYGINGNVLTGIRMLHIFGIELTTGKLMYIRRL